jgi:hypothetical protein
MRGPGCAETIDDLEKEFWQELLQLEALVPCISGEAEFVIQRQRGVGQSTE